MGEGPEHPAHLPALPRKADLRAARDAARALTLDARVHCARRHHTQPERRGGLRAAPPRLQTRPPEVHGERHRRRVQGMCCAEAICSLMITITLYSTGIRDFSQYTIRSALVRSTPLYCPQSSLAGTVQRLYYSFT